MWSMWSEISFKSKLKPRRKWRNKNICQLKKKDQISKQRYGRNFLCLNLMKYKWLEKNKIKTSLTTFPCTTCLTWASRSNSHLERATVRVTQESTVRGDLY